MYRRGHVMEKELQQLKEDLHKKKEAIDEIPKLIKRRIDRAFSTNIWELSEKELDRYVGECITVLSQNADTKPDAGSIASHRKIIGPAIVLMKRIFMIIGKIYSNLVLAKQIEFNRKVVELSQAFLIQINNNKKSNEKIDERIRSCEEILAIVKIKVDELHRGLSQMKNGPEDRNKNA